MSIRVGAAPPSATPSARIPVPESRITRLPSSGRTSMHEVLPPYRTVSGPGVASEPREPQNLARTSGLHGLLPEDGQPAHESICLREQWDTDDLEVTPPSVVRLDPEPPATRHAGPECGGQRHLLDRNRITGGVDGPERSRELRG